MKEIVIGTVSVAKNGMAYLAPSDGYYSFCLGRKLSETVSDGTRAVAVVKEKEDGRLWADAVFEVNIAHSLEHVVERAEQWIQHHAW